MTTTNGSIARSLITGLAVAVAGAAASPLPASAREAHDLTLSKPWMKLIVPSRPAGGYFTLENHGKTMVKLVGASSPGCGTLMLHKSINENGQMKMVMVKSIAVKPGGSVAFEPGDFHLMCMKPNDKVRPGKSVPVTLKFADGTTLTRDFAVKNARGM
ncbi:hypothetical protein COL154_013903 [Colletotrichum chrysophilum]|nr:hypothetical protein COL154_013903 [Colletotrichum chrysophilum]